MNPPKMLPPELELDEY